MPLEFALRPRLSLEPPAPRRRLLRVRLPRLALPVAAYWLAMAGVTHALVRLTAEDSAEGDAHATLMPRTSEVLDDPQSDALPPTTASSPANEQLAEEALVSAPEEQPPVVPAALRPPDPPDPPDPPAQAALAPPDPPVRAALRPPDPPARSAPSLPDRGARAAPSSPSPWARSAPRSPDPWSRSVPSSPDPWAWPASAEEPAATRNEIPKAPVSEEPASAEAPATSVPSCESAAASANQAMDLRAARAAPDLTRDTFASVLEKGTYLTRCAIPARTALSICAAVKDGKVVGVSVTSEPRSPAINACVRRAVAALRFPRNPGLDVTRTRFEAAR